MTQQEFIKDFESKLNYGWELNFENEFAIFTKNTWNSSEDIQWNMIFWFMDICKCLDLDIFNSTSLNITTLTFSGNVIPTLILTVKIKHKLEFEI